MAVLPIRERRPGAVRKCLLAEALGAALRSALLSFRIGQIMEISALIIVIVAVLGFVVWVAIEQQKKERLEKAQAALQCAFSSIPEFSPSQTLVGANLASDVAAALAIDEQGKKVAFLNYLAAEDKTVFKVYPFKHILDVAVFQDGFAVTQTKSHGTLSRAVVGGVLAGGVGALIAGVTAGTTGKQTDKVSLMDLVVTINDLENPCFRVNLVTWSQGLEKASPLYQENAKLANRWESLFRVVIHQSHQEAATV